MSRPPDVVTIMPPAQPLSLDGFILRLPDENDVDALVRFGDDPDTAETLWVPIPSPCSRAEAKERLRGFVDGWSGRSTFGPTLVVAEAASGKFVGIVFLRPREDMTIEIAYGTAPRHRCRGIATCALRGVCQWCFDECSVARVELLIAQGNEASCRVAEKAGFEFRGLRQTHVAGTCQRYDDLLYVLEAPT
jgi:RimJ/RimL family protein N-acetyltransferase